MSVFPDSQSDIYLDVGTCQPRIGENQKSVGYLLLRTRINLNFQGSDIMWRN